MFRRINTKFFMNMSICMVILALLFLGYEYQRHGVSPFTNLIALLTGRLQPFAAEVEITYPTPSFSVYLTGDDMKRFLESENPLAIPLKTLATTSSERENTGI